MAEQITRAEAFEKKAEKKISGWALFGSKFEDAAELYEKAANSYKLAKSWEQAAIAYNKLVNCHLRTGSKHEAAGAYVDAANCYKKISPRQAIKSLEQAVELFSEFGRFNMAARYSKEIGELYEQDHNLDQAIVYLEKAADFFQGEEVTSSANQCRWKVAQFAAQQQQYAKAIEIFEDIASQSVHNNLLKYGVRGHLLNAGICQMCKGDPVAITNALERYQDIDPSFPRTREYGLLALSAIDEENVEKFTDILKEYDSLSSLDSWKTNLLLRVKEDLRAMELEEDDLT
ncbi:hypothetical protein V2J09_007055 [Rumex salicifolius]